MELRAIVMQYLDHKDITLSDDADLMENGMDSLDFVKLVVDLEEEYGIAIDDDDLLIENFSSIQKIENYLTEKCEKNY